MIKQKYIQSKYISRVTIVNFATEVCKKRNMVSLENIEVVIAGMEITKVIMEDRFKQNSNGKH